MYFSRGQITLIQRQPVFALTHKCCVLTGETSLKSMIYHILPLHHRHSTITAPMCFKYTKNTEGENKKGQFSETGNLGYPKTKNNKTKTQRNVLDTTIRK